MLASFSWGTNDDVKLRQEYGHDLTQAPFFLRYKFNKDFKHEWAQSDYAERRAFLADYDNGLAAQKAQEKAEARQAARDKRDQLREKRDEERAAKEKIRQELAQEKDEQHENDARQKQFDQGVNDQQRALKQMMSGTPQ